MSSFLVEYIKHPRTIGAVAPSSKRLAKGMMKPIDFDTCSCIVEYGAGTGAFTAELVKRSKRNTQLIIIEQNKQFYDMLCGKFKEFPNVHIVNGDVLGLRDYMAEYRIKKVDYIVSGLPFTSLPADVSKKILNQTRAILARNDGRFITFQYTMLKKGLFEKFFGISGKNLVLLNLPPAFILTMKPKKPKPKKPVS